MYRKTKINHIHFVGIGGIGMSGIAEVLLNLGYKVSGSDIRKTDITRRLHHLGAKIYYQHHRKNIGGAEVVVFSSAVKEQNPEIRVIGVDPVGSVYKYYKEHGQLPLLERCDDAIKGFLSFCRIEPAERVIGPKLDDDAVGVLGEHPVETRKPARRGIA